MTAIQRIRTAIVKNPAVTIEAIQRQLTKAGEEVSLNTIRTTRSGTLQTLALAHKHGLKDLPSAED